LELQIDVVPTRLGSDAVGRFRSTLGFFRISFLEAPQGVREDEVPKHHCRNPRWEWSGRRKLPAFALAFQIRCGWTGLHGGSCRHIAPQGRIVPGPRIPEGFVMLRQTVIDKVDRWRLEMDAGDGVRCRRASHVRDQASRQRKFGCRSFGEGTGADKAFWCRRVGSGSTGRDIKTSRVVADFSMTLPGCRTGLGPCVDGGTRRRRMPKDQTSSGLIRSRT